jgi:hypothetical protein
MAPKKTSVISVDIYSGKVSGQFINFTTMDVNTASLSFQVKNQENKLALSNVTPKIFLNMEDGSQFVEDCEIVDATNGVVQYTLKSNEIKHSGRVDAEFYLVYTDSSIGSFNFTFYIKKSAIDTISVPAQEVAIIDMDTFKASLEARLDDTQATLTSVQQQVTDAQTQADTITNLINQNQVAKQSDVTSLTTQMADKAKQTDLNTTNNTVALKANQSDLATQVSRIDNLTANVGNASGNSEIVDIRTGYDGYNHTSAGNATRNQIKWLPIIDLSVASNYVASSFINASGDVVSAGGFRRSNAITIPTGVKTIEIRNWQTNSSIWNVVFYSSSSILKANIVGHSSAFEVGAGYTGVVTIPPNATYVVFSCPDTQILRCYWYRDEIVSGIATIASNNTASINTLTGQLTSKVSTYTEYSANRNDESQYTYGSWWNNGALTSNQYTPTFTASGYMYISGFTNVCIWTRSSSATLLSYYFLDANKVNISGRNDLSQQINSTTSYTVPVPVNAVYFVAAFSNVQNTDKSIKCNLMVENSTSPTTWVEFSSNVKIDVPYYNNKIVEHDNEITAINSSLSGVANAKVNIDLPKAYYAVIGDTLEIFVSGILECEDWSNYYVQFTGSVNKGNSYKRKWVYTPGSGDADFTLKVTVYDNVGNLLSTATTQIKILTRKSSVSTTRNVLCMGDSLTEDGVWAGELKRRLTATGGTPSADGVSNVNFIGSCLTNGVNFEGYGGWNWNSYLTVGETMYWLTVSSGMKDSTMHESVWSDGTNQWTLETIGTSNKLKFKRTIVSGSYTMPASGTLTYVSGGSSDHTNIVFSVSSLASGNPFWNPTTSAVDFTYYCTNLGVSSIDYLVVLLGWNSVLNAVVDGNVTSGKSFIDKLHTAFPNCKVIISGLQVPNENGWGYNYGTYVDGQWQKDYLTIKNSAHDLNVAYENWCLETGYSSYLTFSQLCGQFDMEYSYDYLSTPVNVRNTTTEKIFMNCIHPSANGKYQIADAMYRVLESKLS